MNLSVVLSAESATLSKVAQGLDLSLQQPRIDLNATSLDTLKMQWATTALITGEDPFWKEFGDAWKLKGSLMPTFDKQGKLQDVVFDLKGSSPLSEIATAGKIAASGQITTSVPTKLASTMNQALFQRIYPGSPFKVAADTPFTLFIDPLSYTFKPFKLTALSGRLDVDDLRIVYQEEEMRLRALSAQLKGDLARATFNLQALTGAGGKKMTIEGIVSEYVLLNHQIDFSKAAWTLNVQCDAFPVLLAEAITRQEGLLTPLIGNQVQLAAALDPSRVVLAPNVNACRLVRLYWPVSQSVVLVVAPAG
jgi:hypothetical protein